MITLELTKEEVKSLIPLYKRAESASKDSYCSSPVTKQEFDLMVSINKAHGFTPPTSFTCGSCIIWNLKTTYRLLSDPSNIKTVQWYLKHK